ncbi:MAG TPA: hypothetical protein VFQ84_07275 [Arenimonas sp.]|uniref:hypothetical protein n=1 Tax=Arenimonas sp. TaxID=1872635 RepID=UPI002D7F24C6|nr:hypothetical protein [Arenimonas sp.]HEU0153129.1 hypothetical protein [Arenimonas sp.]
MFPIRTLSLLALLAALSTGCGRSQDQAAEALAEEALEASTGAEIDIENKDGVNRVTARTEQGELVHSSGENVPLPANFPADVRLPADYAVMSVMTMGPATSVVMRSPEPMSELFTGMRRDQAAGGWKETMSMQGADGSMLGFEKDGRSLLVNLRDDLDGQTVVSLSLQAAD